MLDQPPGWTRERRVLTRATKKTDIQRARVIIASFSPAGYTISSSLDISPASASWGGVCSSDFFFDESEELIDRAAVTVGSVSFSFSRSEFDTFSLGTAVVASDLAVAGSSGTWLAARFLRPRNFMTPGTLEYLLCRACARYKAREGLQGGKLSIKHEIKVDRQW